MAAFGVHGPFEISLTLAKNKARFIDTETLSELVQPPRPLAQAPRYKQGPGKGLLIIGDAMVIADKTTYKDTCSRPAKGLVPIRAHTAGTRVRRIPSPILVGGAE